MNIAELKKLIEGLPDNMQVILQKDAEGNGYSPCAGADPDAIYIPENTYSGEVYDCSWTAEDADVDSDEWEAMKIDNPRVLVLHPIN